MASTTVNLPWWANFLAAGLGACTAEVATLPIDTAKVRLQLLKRSGDVAANVGRPAGASIGMLSMMRLIASEEGVAALYKGFWPAIHRQLVFASLRIGLYGQIATWFRRPGETNISLGRKVLAGLTSGAIGITVANPTDLVKVRMQGEGRLAPGQKPRYNGVVHAYTHIVRTEGLVGLWTGLGPAVARNSIINATELASYDTAKELLLAHTSVREGLGMHVLAGAAAGLMATIIGNPVDVVKTRVMAARRAAESAAVSVTAGVTAAGASASAGASAPAAASAPPPVMYSGALDCIVKTFQHEGPRAFYQGVVPQFFRLTGWSIVMFVSFEQLKMAAARSLA